jgi:Zn-dependent protease with chaperone function
MPILIVFALTAACLPVRWPGPLLGGGSRTAAASTAAAVTLALAAAVLLRTWVVRTLRRQPARKAEVTAAYARLRRLLFFANVGLAAACVLVLGWGAFVRAHLVVPGRADADGGPLLAPFAELAVPLPYFAILFGAWVVYYDAERALHRTTPAGVVDRPFWGRAGYFVHHLRQFALLAMLPVGLFVTQQTASRFAPETTQTEWYRAAQVAAVPVLVLFLPLLIRPLLGLKPLPPGPARDRLEATARRLHFRCSGLLLWPTHGAAANAMIVGLLPRVRYVIFTDRVLDELDPDELDAVFGHEVGHAKHGHVWLYAGFVLLSVTVLAAGMLLLGQRLDAAGVRVPEWAEGWVALPPLALMAGYLFLVFGFLSRRCERQADVYGCRAVSCADPNCGGHDARTHLPDRAAGLCPTGIRTFVRALDRVAFLGGYVGPAADRRRSSAGRAAGGLFRWLRAWQHSTPERRTAFLLGLIGRPDRERRFQRGVAVLRWGLILGLAAALYGLGGAVGWGELLQVL